jgi:hypothetical protein
MGEGVQYWSVSDPSVPWLWTIPGPDVAHSYSSYPPGPLTVGVDSDYLSLGTYTSQLTGYHGPGTLDSPQTITLALLVLEPFRVHLPIVLRQTSQ